MKVLKEQAYEKIAQLVERFSEHVEEYKRNNYNEHQTRVDYINPFFKALGWDMDNEQGYAEAYREVIHEDKVKVGSSTKAPDYGFTLFGQRKFFVDAKKPAVNIKSDISPAYQVRRYGWSAKVPISIVTDFEEFSIYDCTKKPKPTDKASVARIKYITYDKYLDEFDFLWDVFAKENLPKGRFDKYVQSDTRRKGTASVDSEFLKSIEQWRTYLATTIALRNKSLNEDEINYAVQKIIDRIIFLRMCEDRGVEQYGELKKATVKGEIYQNLFALYHMADNKYNSGLFDFKEDKITPTLTVDNKVMKNIIKELYYPNCEYEFSVMPADILGSVYEQFLGKTIRLTKAHHAKIEEKPEVRKAGGVYYTPKYIVDYIVENTVGKLIEGKTPKQIEKIKICDPACGSGSFLIGAYQFLLDRHLKYYTPKFKRLSIKAESNSYTKKQRKEAISNRKKIPLTPNGNLTTAEKKRILLNNIYGVDIDTQAVEVTKLNLLLKAMEGETQSSMSVELRFGERVLPNLSNNIKCGNSLIGNDFYDNQLNLFPDQMKKVNAFDWKEGFPEIFIHGGLPTKDLKKAGFDVVIGNPPYGATLSETEDNYLRLKYNVASYQLDTYSLFFEKAFLISSTNGRVGYIIPSAWTSSVYDIKLREFLYKNIVLDTIVITPKRTFKDATVETLILTCKKGKKTKDSFNVERWEGINTYYSIPYSEITPERKYSFPVYSNPNILRIVNRCQKTTKTLNDFAEVVWGVKVYEKGKGKPPQKGNENKTKVFHSNKKESVTHRPLIGGKDIFRYNLRWKGAYLNYGRWLAAPRNPNWFQGSRIVIREVTTKGVIQATLIDGDYVFSNSVDGVRLQNNRIELKFLLGLINSKLISFYHTATSPNAFKSTFPKILLKDLRELPIPKPEKTIHDQIVLLVNNLLKLNEQLQTTNLETQRTQIQRTIHHSERKIDDLVYELYGLSEEEIEIIERI